MTASTPPVLRNRLRLEARVDVPDAAGGQDAAWLAVGDHPAQIQPASGSESFAASRQAQRVTHRVIVRCAPFGAAARPRADQRFRVGDRVFDIKAVFERDGRGRYLTCLSEEGALG